MDIKDDASKADGEATAQDFPGLQILYNDEVLLPHSFKILRPDGAELRTLKRFVIEVDPYSLPRIIEMEQA